LNKCGHQINFIAESVEMKKLVVVSGLGLGLVLLLLPGGCALSLAVAGGAISAATTDPACLSEETSDRASCAPGFSLSSGGAPTAEIDPGSIPAPDPWAAVAVHAAIDAVGHHGRYIAEGNGPVDFDCSGLTSFAWRAAGVQIVDYSFTQWNQTRRIPRELLAPGDLVFWFGGDVHHVAIVVAVNGAHVQIAEAANPDVGIRIRDFGDSWDQTYVTGYGRVSR